MNTKQALIDAIKQSDLSVREKLALRLALVFHADKVDAIVKDTLADEGMSTASDVSKTDWAAIIKFFIENILPLLLKLLA
jgi:hypothetical protein